MKNLIRTRRRAFCRSLSRLIRRLSFLALCSLLPFCSQGAIIELKAKETVTALEMNHGDTLRFQLRNGETRTLVLEDTAARIIERVQPGGTIYSFSLRFRIDSKSIDLVRYASTQQAFYEPYVINGVRIWPDTAKNVFDLIPIRHPLDKATGVRIPKTGNMDATPRKDARLVIQDATLRVCPDELHPWANDPHDFIDVARCYGGDDTHLGAYFGKLCHVGLDINHPKGSPLFAPIDFDTQAYWDSLKMGGNNNRWRGIRRWQNSDVWALQTSHLIDLLVPEHQPLKKGTQYATSAGVHIGSHQHTHYDFRIGRPQPGTPIDQNKPSIAIPIDFSDQSDTAEKNAEVLILDAWIIFWQTFEDLKAREGRIRADMQPPGPANTGQAVEFSASGSRPPRGSDQINYYWTFGDGGWATGPSPTHRYAQPGIYPVTLVVASGEGRASRTMHLTVSGESVSQPVLAFHSDETSFRSRPANVTDVYGWPVGDIPHTVRIRTHRGASRPEPRVVHLRNLGGGTLPAVGPIKIEYESGKAWLKVIRTGQGNHQALAVAVDPDPLKPGNMCSAIVTVTGDGALNSPQGFRVELTMLREPPPTEVAVDDRDGDFYATPYFWVGHRFSRCPPDRRGYAGFYLTNGGRSTEGEFVRFSPYLATGQYRVMLARETPFPSDSEFTAQVRHAGGESVVRVVPNRSRVLGTFAFNEELPTYVQLEAMDSRGTIVADAIRFVRVEQ
jgi:hypothetical protein